MRNRIAILLMLLIPVLGWSQVPDNDAFTLDTVRKVIGLGANATLRQCFQNANADYYDPTYNQVSYAPDSSLRRFRNYHAGTTCTPTYCGLYYNRASLTNIANTGWRVPDNSDWSTLVVWLESNGYGYGGSGSDIAKSIASKTCWYAYATEGSPGNNASSNNSTGLNLKPGGEKDYWSGFNGNYSNGNATGAYWSTTEGGGGWFEYKELAYSSGYLANQEEQENYGFRVRLIKNTTTLTHGQTGTYTGNDGHVYTTIAIGNPAQEWMSEDLAETRNADLSRILIATDDLSWRNNANAKACAYNFDLNTACVDTSNFVEPPEPEICNNYGVSYSTGSLTEGGTSIELFEDDGVMQISLPFDFYFFDTSYSSVYVITNGYISFSSDVVEYSYESFPTSILENVICAEWADLSSSDAGDIDTITTGSAPNRCFIIRYDIPTLDLSPEISEHFEFRLFETTNNIEIVYGATTLGVVDCTRGIQKGTGDVYYQYSGNVSDGKLIKYEYCGVTIPEPEICGYGLLYNWYAVSGTGDNSIAKSGWHVPTKTEVDALNSYVQYTYPMDFGWGLKDTSSTYWDTPNSNTNYWGFYARGSAYRANTGGFQNLNGTFCMWIDDQSYNMLYMAYNYNALAFGHVNDTEGMAVRLIKDEVGTWQEGDKYYGNDGTEYYTVKIGDQVWLAENLKETKLRNNTPIPEVKGDSDWSALTTGALCAYNNDWSNACMVRPGEEGFIFTVSVGDATTIDLPLGEGYNYNFTVDWGDNTGVSTVTAWDDTGTTHTYVAGGDYTVTILGTCEAFNCDEFYRDNYLSDYLTSIVQWGDCGFVNLCLAYCYYIESLPDGPITGASGVESLYKFLYHNEYLTSIPESMFSLMPNVLSFEASFEGCVITEIPEDIFKYNTLAESFLETFSYCENITTLPAGLFRYNTNAIDFENTFLECISLTDIPSDLFRYNTLVEVFNSTFQYCSSLDSLPADLFRYNTNVINFESTFLNSGVAHLPADLFRYNTNVYRFGYTFSGCSSLSSIPTGLFSYNTDVTYFYATFLLSGLSAIPSGLFDNNTKVTWFYQTFMECVNITSIPIDLFRYNTDVINFNYTFAGCDLLSSIPTDLFRYNTRVINFGYTFSSCDNLTSAPEGLLRYNTDASNFQQTFGYCPKLQLNKYIFYNEGEQSTRFAGKTIDFSYCFYPTDNFTGQQGTAPDLWNCTFGSVISNGTFGGHSNSSLTNYNSIPYSWK